MSKLAMTFAMCALVTVFALTYAVMSYTLEKSRPELVDTRPGSDTASAPNTATATSPVVTEVVDPTVTAVSRPEMRATSTLSPPTPTARSEPPTATPPPTARSEPPTVTPRATPTLPVISIVPSPQPRVSDLEVIIDRVIDAEAALQSGQVDASVEYSDGTRSSTSIVFDFGATDAPARAAIRTTYHSGGQTRVAEQIVVGSRAWGRVDGGGWQEVSNVEGVWGQVQVFLPRLATRSQPQPDSDAGRGVLRWYDPVRNADVTLRVDPDSGEPSEMNQVTRGTNSTLSVTYTGWNTPVQIDAPVE